MLGQHLIRMVINKSCKMTVKGVKSKSESFFSLSHGVLELWRKNLKGGGGDSASSLGMDRVNSILDEVQDIPILDGGGGGAMLLRRNRV